MIKEYVDTNMLNGFNVAIFKKVLPTETKYCLIACKCALSDVNHDITGALAFVHANGFSFEELIPNASVVIGHHETKVINAKGDLLLNSRNRQLLDELDNCRVYSYH